jgi:hypothetical protein
MDEWYVEIIRSEDNVCVKQMGPFSSRTAERIAGGVNINLNHAEYHVDVIDEPTDANLIEDGD